MNKIFLNVILLVVILLVGSSGYVLIEGSSYLDGLYMTLITITTVGYGEVIPLSPGGKYFTMFLMLVGVGFVLYLFSNITDAVVEGKLRQVFGRINMDKKLSRLKDHFIVCGYGRIGKVICESLLDSQREFVIIENNPEEIKEMPLPQNLWVFCRLFKRQPPYLWAFQGICVPLFSGVQFICPFVGGRYRRPSAIVPSGRA